jgi:hypothetical protein
MGDICLGAYATLQDAEDAKAARPEPVEELSVVEDGDAETPFRVWWSRPG